MKGQKNIIMKNAKKISRPSAADKLIEFINASPTPMHAVNELKKLLHDVGASEITPSEIDGSLSADKLYYTVFGGTCIAAFTVGTTLDKGFRIGAAHIDYPVLKIKPSPSRISCGIERINVEGYGGTIHHTWLDRPLKIAGRIYYKGPDGEIKYADTDGLGKTLIIPSAAIHIVRDVNDGAKFSIQNELLPFLCKADSNGRHTFLARLAAEVSAASAYTVTPDDILSFDLSLLDAAPACYTGADNEFISAPGLDDKAMAFSLFSAISGAPGKDAAYNTAPCAAFAFDHEECGSQSLTGARSAFAKGLIRSICTVHGSGGEGAFLDTMQKSFAISADMAHATHPSYESKSDATAPIRLGGGPVLKTSSNQSYSTSAAASAFLSGLCKSSCIPLQYFTNHSDARGGGTIGPMLSAALGITTADIGNPMLAMHSARELCSAEDQEYITRLFRSFFGISGD